MNIVKGRRSMATIQQWVCASDYLALDLTVGETTAGTTTLTIVPTHNTTNNTLEDIVVPYGTITWTSLRRRSTDTANNTTTDIIRIIDETVKSIIIIITTVHTIITLTLQKRAEDAILCTLTT